MSQRHTCLGAVATWVAMGGVPGLAQDAAEAGFTGQVDAPIGLHGASVRRLHVFKPGFVGRW